MEYFTINVISQDNYSFELRTLTSQALYFRTLFLHHHSTTTTISRFLPINAQTSSFPLVATQHTPWSKSPTSSFLCSPSWDVCFLPFSISFQHYLHPSSSPWLLHRLLLSYSSCPSPRLHTHLSAIAQNPFLLDYVFFFSLSLTNIYSLHQLIVMFIDSSSPSSSSHLYARWLPSLLIFYLI